MSLRKSVICCHWWFVHLPVFWSEKRKWKKKCCAGKTGTALLVTEVGPRAQESNENSVCWSCICFYSRWRVQSSRCLWSSFIYQYNYCPALTTHTLWVILLSLSGIISSGQPKEQLLQSYCVLQYSITIPLSSLLWFTWTAINSCDLEWLPLRWMCENGLKMCLCNDIKNTIKSYS